MSDILVAYDGRLPEVTTYDWQVTETGLAVPEGCVRPSELDIQELNERRRHFIGPESEMLQRTAKEVTQADIDSGAVGRVFDKMRQAAGVGKERNLVGIAATQVATEEDEELRLVGIDLNIGVPGNTEDLAYLINPQYEPLDKGEYLEIDSCFSTDGGAGWTPRYRGVRLTASGRIVPHEEGTGFDVVDFAPVNLIDDTTYVEGQFPKIPARITQHEIDHINGIRWTDRMIKAIEQGKVTPELLWWLHQEHGRQFGGLMRQVRRLNTERKGADRVLPDWPYRTTAGFWRLYQTGKIVLPTLTEVQAYGSADPASR